MKNEIIIGGEYQHYKGNRYKVLTIGHHSETLEKVVVYQGLYKDPKFGVNPVWVRPYNMWFDQVNYQGKVLSRFISVF